MIKARDYQKEAVSCLFRYFETHVIGNPLVAMPTGTGKSVVIALFLMEVFRLFSNQKVIVCTHVKELIEQNYQKCIQVWPNAPAGINSAGVGRYDYFNNIIFGGIGTIFNKAARFGVVNLLVIDEAHLVSPEDETMYRKFIADLMAINPCLRIIGLTATPWRMGQGHITSGGLFTDVAFDITGMEAFNRLIAEGYLAPLVTQKPSLIVGTDGIRMRGQDYAMGDVQKAFDKESITRAALNEVLEVGHNRKAWLLFASGVEHVGHVTDMLLSMGIPAVGIHSKMKAAQRDNAIGDFKEGRYRAAVNNNVLTTGFDHPLIDLIAVLRHTASSPLWVQMLGRGTRPVYAPGFDLSTTGGRIAAIEAGPKQDCAVLDFGNNIKRLGPVNDPLIPRKKGEKAGVAPVRECPSCGTWNHASLRFCGGKPEKTNLGCGFEFPQHTKITEEASTKDVMKGDAPIVQLFKVDHLTYSVHRKHDVPDMMKVSYYCNLQLFHEYVSIENPRARGLAVKWLKERGHFHEGNMPSSTEEILVIANELKAPSHIRVWINKKYPEILAYCYDGTAFGTIAAQAGPKIEVHKGVMVASAGKVSEQLTKISKLEKSAYGFESEDEDMLSF